MDSERIPLRALSARQQRLVERHLGLVYLTLDRHPQLILRRRPCREPDELFQEGCLALMKALQTHDPVRHGHFATFALARIHYALSLYGLEHEHAVRVPYITQRRRRAELKACPWTPTDGVPLPKTVSMQDARRLAGPSLSSERCAEGSQAADAAVTLGELIRDRYDLALRQVVRDMKNAARCAANNREVVERCCEERWEIPEAEMRTSFRELARRLNCSKGANRPLRGTHAHQSGQEVDCRRALPGAPPMGTPLTDGIAHPNESTGSGMARPRSDGSSVRQDRAG